MEDRSSPTSSDMEVSKLSIDKTSEIFEDFKSHAVSENTFPEQWRKLQSSFAMVEASMMNQAKELELKEKEVTERNRELELKEKKLNEGFLACQKELKLKKEELIEVRKKLELQEKNLKEQSSSLELQAQKLILEQKELGLKEIEMNERFKEMEMKEKLILQSREGLELIEKEVDERFQAVELKEKEVSEQFQALDLRKKQANKSKQGLELKEKKLDDRFQALALKESEMGKRLRALEAEKKRLDEYRRRLELKEKQAAKYLELLEMGKKQMNDGFESLELKVKQLEDYGKGIEMKFRLVVESKEKQLEEGVEALEIKLEEIEDCCKFMELKEKEINDRCNTLELKEKDFNEQCQSLELKEKELKEGIQALKLKEKQIDDKYRELEMKEKKINDRCEAMEVKEKQIRRRHRALDLREEQMKKHFQAQESEDKQNSKSCSSMELEEKQVNQDSKEAEFEEEQCCGTSHGEASVRLNNENLSKTKNGAEGETGETVPETCLLTSAAASSSISLSDDIEDIELLCKNMDAKGVRSFLIQHIKEYDIFDNKLLDSLQSASDPAKLVLNVMQSFYELELDKVPVQDFTAVCILLLVQLMKLRADISSHVKDEAGKFADIWRLLLKQGNTALENFGFLQFLASFKLAESYNANELLSLFITLFDESEVYLPEKNPYLCDALGLTKIPDIIQSLILRDEQLLAVRYICAFKMEDAFPLVPLVCGHLKYIHNRVEKIIKQGSRTAKDDAADMELTALKSLVECISDCKLESCYSPVCLEMRIKQLEKEREERNSRTRAIVRCANLEKLGIQKIPETSDPPVLPYDTKNFPANANSMLSPEKESKQLDKEREKTKTSADPSPIQSCSNSEKRGEEETAETSNPSALPSDAQYKKKRPANSIVLRNEKRPRVAAQPELIHCSYGYPVGPHQASPVMGWHGYHIAPSWTTYAIPYNPQTGEYGAPGIYPVGAPAFACTAWNQTHRRA